MTSCSLHPAHEQKYVMKIHAKDWHVEANCEKTNLRMLAQIYSAFEQDQMYI